MKYFSTFTGIGGFEIGIHNAYRQVIPQQDTVLSDSSPDGEGLWQRGEQDAPRCVGYSEIDKYASSVYERHYPNVRNYGDITKINADELPDFDLLVGGFPCQAFSIAGKRRGFEDTRGTLFFDLARILKAKTPRLFVFENVKGLLSHDGGATFKTIIAATSELGYDCQWQVLNSKNHGVPQNRERIIIVGHLRGTPRPEVFPITGDNGQDTRKIGQELAPTIDAHYYKGWSPNGQQSSKRQLVSDDSRIRKLTPIECERLQAFPDDWTKYGKDNEFISDTQRYKMAGNAVTTNVIRDVMEKVLT
jgi:DNA (cytosine-5)-methyltransferase 1